MECLKFELFSPCVTFKTPFSLKGIEAYPLPPYSTVIGLLYTAIGRKWQGEEFSISVQGEHEAVFRDYIRLRKYNRKEKKLEPLPLEIPRLYRFEGVIHVCGEKELLEEFREALLRPKVYLFLGGGEYPVLVKNPRFVGLEERSLYDELKHSAYVPESKASPFYSKGINYRVPSFFERVGKERAHRWERVFYMAKGMSFEGKVLIDEEGDSVWV